MVEMLIGGEKVCDPDERVNFEPVEAGTAANLKLKSRVTVAFIEVQWLSQAPPVNLITSDT